MAHPAIEVARGIWAASPCDLWVVGANGIILHWNGTAWSTYAQPGGRQEQFYAIRGSSAKSVFAVTGGAIIRWDGTAWSDITQPAPFGNYRSVWATGPSEAFVLGIDATSKPLVVRWDGTTWIRLPDPPALKLPPRVWSVWASGPADVWVTGEGELYRWNGSGWVTVVPPGVTGDLMAIWGSSANDVWVAGTQPKLAWHWDGAAWTQVATPMTINTVRIAGTAPNNVWMVGQGGQVANWCGAGWAAQNASVPSALFVADVAVSGGTSWIAGFDSNATPSGSVLKRQ